MIGCTLMNPCTLMHNDVLELQKCWTCTTMLAPAHAVDVTYRLKVDSLKGQKEATVRVSARILRLCMYS